MKIDIDANIEELNDDHPTLRVLSDEEAGLYQSAVMNSAAAGERIVDHWNEVEEVEEFDPEAPELEPLKKKLRGSMALTNLIEEVASVRRALLNSETFQQEYIDSESLDATQAGGDDE